MAGSQELITGEPPDSGLIFWAPHLLCYSNCFDFYGRLVTREKLFFKVVFLLFFIKRAAFLVTFRAQPLAVISSAGTGRVEFAGTGWTPRLSLYHILALSNGVSLSGTSQHEPFCKLFFSNFPSISLSEAKVEPLRKRSFNKTPLITTSCALLVSLLPFAAFDGISGSERHRYNAEQKKKTSKRLFIGVLSVSYL